MAALPGLPRCFYTRDRASHIKKKKKELQNLERDGGRFKSEPRGDAAPDVNPRGIKTARSPLNNSRPNCDQVAHGWTQEFIVRPAMRTIREARSG